VLSSLAARRGNARSSGAPRASLTALPECALVSTALPEQWKRATGMRRLPVRASRCRLREIGKLARVRTNLTRRSREREREREREHWERSSALSPHDDNSCPRVLPFRFVARCHLDASVVGLGIIARKIEPAASTARLIVEEQRRGGGGGGESRSERVGRNLNIYCRRIQRDAARGKKPAGILLYCIIVTRKARRKMLLHLQLTNVGT